MDAGLHIHEASEVLGVPPSTLRSWERRYGLPITLRSPGGHRRYTPSALTELAMMRDEVGAGHGAVDAARRVRRLLDERNPCRPRIDALVETAIAHDTAAAEAVLDEARDRVGLGPTIDGVVLPAMRLIGAWWESGRCDVGQEHFLTRVVRQWLAMTTTLAPPATSEAMVLLATGPRDTHTLGLEALAALLATQGTRCRILGAHVAPQALLDACVGARRSSSSGASSPASAVVIVSHLSTQRRAAIESIVMVAAGGRPTYYAGKAFLPRVARRAVPGTYLGESISSAAVVVRTALPTGLPPRLADAG